MRERKEVAELVDFRGIGIGSDPQLQIARACLDGDVEQERRGRAAGPDRHLVIRDRIPGRIHQQSWPSGGRQNRDGKGVCLGREAAHSELESGDLTVGEIARWRIGRVQPEWCLERWLRSRRRSIARSLLAWPLPPPGHRLEGRQHAGQGTDHWLVQTVVQLRDERFVACVLNRGAAELQDDVAPGLHETLFGRVELANR